MKFIHVSDIHIGMSPDPTMFWSEDRANDIKETFSNVIKKCDEEDADLLLISGNLFSHQPLTEELDYVNNLFKTIPNTKVLVIAGSADHIKSNSPILNYSFSDNVYYFRKGVEDLISIKGTKVTVHGFSYFSIEDPSRIIDSITPDNDKDIHILLAYGGDSRHTPFDLNKLSDKNFSYVALGSKHQFEELVENKIYYPGALEPLCADDMGEHGIIIGEINEHTKRVQNLRFEKMAKVSYLPIKFKINGLTTEDEIAESITREVIKRGANNIYKVQIYGYRNPDLELSKDIFSNKIRIIEFIDSSNPKYDFIKLSSEHPQDMIGAFIRKMTSTGNELSEIEMKALYLGTHALIKTIDKSEG